jgi:hypothetical protein
MTASSRAIGVSGTSVGHEARKMLSACADAALRSFNIATCASVGRIARSIWSIGKLTTLGARPPQVRALLESASRLACAAEWAA